MADAPALQALLALHEVDVQIDQLQSRKKQLPVSLRHIRERLDRQQATRTAKADQLKRLRADTHAKEVLLQAAEEQVEQLVTRLNTASSNKEYTAIQHEITGKRTDASRIEDQVLAAMATIEALEADIRQTDEAIRQIRQEHDEEAEKVAEAASELDEQIRALQAERERAAQAVDPDLLDEYRRIAARKGPSAVAPAINGVCQGCFMQLPPQLAHTLTAGHSVVHCPSCNRILYAP